MSTNYPSSLDAYTSPTGTDTLSVAGHNNRHTNTEDAIEAIEATLGTDPQGGESTVKDRIAAAEAVSAELVKGNFAVEPYGNSTDAMTIEIGDFQVASIDVNVSTILTVNGVASGTYSTQRLEFLSVSGSSTVTWVGITNWYTDDGTAPTIIAGDIVLLESVGGTVNAYMLSVRDRSPRTDATTAIVGTDHGRTVTRSSATATIPQNINLALPVGFWCLLVAGHNSGLALTTTNLTIVGANVACAKDEVMYIEKLATDTWLVAGGTA